MDYRQNVMTLSLPEPTETLNVGIGGDEHILLRRYTNPGKPAVALSHGNGFAIDAYYPFWSLLLKQFDLFIFDMRHHGRNAPQDPDNTGLQQYASDFDQICQAIRNAAPSVPFYAGLHSIAAIVSLIHASGFSAPPDHLVLFDPPMQPPQGHELHNFAHAFELKLAEWSANRPDRFETPQHLAAQFLKSRSLSGWVEGAHALMAQATLRQTENEWILACPPSVESQNYLANAQLISWDLIAKSPVPITLIAADPDHPAGQSPARVCAAIEEDQSVPYHRIADTTHLLQIEKPLACAETFKISVGNT
jgi:pimeloyl-ACP methyl ester carboxylesterase